MNGNRSIAELEAAAQEYAVATEEPRPMNLRPVDLSGVMVSKLSPPRFIVKPWLPRRQVALLGAHGGLGKTNLALVIAAHVASGSRFADMEVEQGQVVFASLEDEPELILYRLRLIVEEYQLNHFEVLENITLLDGTSGCAALMTEGMANGSPVLLTAAYRDLADHCAGAGLVVVDNASDAFDANENQRRHVRGFIRALTEIARDNDAAVLLLAHIDKAAARTGSQGNSYSGSTAWHNSVRSRLAILDQDGFTTVEHEKNNLGPKAEPLPITFSGKGVPVPTVRASSTCREGQDRQDLIACFTAAEAAGLNIPANLTPGGYSAMAALANLVEYPKHLQAGPGKRQAPKLLTAMLRDGLLADVEYERSHRKKGRRLVLTTGAKSEPESC